MNYFYLKTVKNILFGSILPTYSSTTSAISLRKTPAVRAPARPMGNTPARPPCPSTACRPMKP